MQHSMNDNIHIIIASETYVIGYFTFEDENFKYRFENVESSWSAGGLAYVWMVFVYSISTHRCVLSKAFKTEASAIQHLEQFRMQYSQ